MLTVVGVRAVAAVTLASPYVIRIRYNKNGGTTTSIGRL